MINTLNVIEDELDVERFSTLPGLMMDWEQVKRLKETGHIIGSHTVSHPNTALLNESVLMKELTESRTLLESHLAESIVHFSYPNPMVQPHWTDATGASVLRAGYKTAVTSNSGAVIVGDNPVALHRMPVPENITSFQWNLESSFLGRAV